MTNDGFTSHPRLDTSRVLRRGQEGDPAGGVRGSEGRRARRVQATLPESDQRWRRRSESLGRVGGGGGDGEAGRRMIG